MNKVNEFEHGSDIHYSNDVNTNYVKFSVDSNLHYRFSSAEDLLNDLDTLAAMIKHHHILLLARLFSCPKCIDKFHPEISSLYLDR